jgi:hypothetical protein
MMETIMKNVPLSLTVMMLLSSAIVCGDELAKNIVGSFA